MSTASATTARTIRELSHNAQMLLALLSDGQWKSQEQCMEAGGMRFGGRIHDLRRAGHRIEAQRLGTRRWFYRLIPPTDLFG